MSLAGCVASLSASCSILSGSLSTLEQGISDFARLSSVLQNQRHFELLPEGEVLAAQRDLKEEVAPQRDELLNRANKALAQLERVEYSLRKKKELQEVRLQQRRPASGVGVGAGAGAGVSMAKSAYSNYGTAGGSSDRFAGDDAEQDDKAEQMRALRKKKEKLQYSLNRLQMEAVGRKARMSLAPGAFGQ